MPGKPDEALVQDIIAFHGSVEMARSMKDGAKTRQRAKQGSKQAAEKGQLGLTDATLIWGDNVYDLALYRVARREFKKTW